MHFLKFALLASILLLVSYRPAAHAGEKGGSGIDGADVITLENFDLSKTCPEDFARSLCEKINNKMKYPNWKNGNNSEQDQIQEDFFNQCCMFAPDTTGPINGK